MICRRGTPFCLVALALSVGQLRAGNPSKCAATLARPAMMMFGDVQLQTPAETCTVWLKSQSSADM